MNPQIKLVSRKRSLESEWLCDWILDICNVQSNLWKAIHLVRRHRKMGIYRNLQTRERENPSNLWIWRLRHYARNFEGIRSRQLKIKGSKLKIRGKLLFFNFVSSGQTAFLVCLSEWQPGIFRSPLTPLYTSVRAATTKPRVFVVASWWSVSWSPTVEQQEDWRKL